MGDRKNGHGKKPPKKHLGNKSPKKYIMYNIFTFSYRYIF